LRLKQPCRRRGLWTYAHNILGKQALRIKPLLEVVRKVFA